MWKRLLLVAVVVWAGMPSGPKTRSTEDRLNKAMPRIPWPQTSTGPAYNSSYGASNNSYGPGNNSYTSGNYSYPTGTGSTGGSNSSWTSNQGSGTVEPWSHAHTMYHSHDLGSLPGDFNQLRASYSDTVSAFNNHIGDHGNLVVTIQALRQSHSDLVSTVQALRASHSDLVTQHNAAVGKLENSNVFQ